MTAARWVAAIGVCAIVAAFAVALARSEPRRSGTNLAPNGAFVVGLSEGQQVCQEQELLPADTAAVRLTIGTYGKPGPPVSVNVTSAGGQTLTDGSLAAGWRQGVVSIPVRRVASTHAEARVCLREAGNAPGQKPIALAGDAPDPGYALEVDGRTIEAERLRFDYLRPGRESWYQLLPTIAHRFSLAKAGFLRHWEWAAALVLALATAALAIRTALAYAAPSDRAR